MNKRAVFTSKKHPTLSFVISLLILTQIMFISSTMGISQATQGKKYTLITYKASKIDLTKITLDGDASDWKDIPASATVNLTGLYGHRWKLATFKVAFNTTHIAILYKIDDDFNMATDNRLSAAVAIMWAISDEAGPFMGSTDETGTQPGAPVDIWHWWLNGSYRALAGGQGKVDSGKDPIGHLDDKHSTYADDLKLTGENEKENSLFGSWGFEVNGKTVTTPPENDTEGSYVVEIIRPLQTSDDPNNDAQFQEGQTYKLALAYWDPDQSSLGWLRNGHLISPINHYWIYVGLGVEPEVPQEKSTYGFEVLLAVISILGLVTTKKIIRTYDKKNKK